MREREIKLEPPDIELSDAELDSAVAAVDGVRIERVESRVLTAHYYDTVDARLARWGCSLRHRDDEGWTIKLPVAKAGSEVTRDEVHVADDEAADRSTPDALQPPGAALRIVEPFLRGEPLQRRVTLVTHRRALVLTVDGVPFGELTDDRVSVERADAAGGAESEPNEFRELELELASAGSASKEHEKRLASVARSVLDALESLGCTASTHTSKVARALGPRAAAPPDVVVPELDDAPTTEEVVRYAFATSVRQLLLELAVVRAGDEPEGVHQSRVALRRLRSDLKTFRPVLDRAWANDLRSRAKWLADALGRVRDDDVHLGILDRSGTPTAAVDAIRKEREQHRVELLDSLDQPHTRALLQSLVAAANEPVLTAGADEPAGDTLTPFVRKRWKRLRRGVRSLPDQPATTELHAVRILTKRCRYATMAAAPALPDSAADFAKLLGKLQDTLGAIHDNDLLSERLRDLARDLPNDAFALGEVAGRLHRDAEAARRQWPRRWKAAKKASPF